MKKLLIVLLSLILLITVVGCGDSKSDLTMDQVKKNFEDNGYIYNEEKEPAYSLISAKDGVWFDKEGATKVVVYEYANKKVLKEAQDANAFMANFETNGLFLLETSDDNIKEIFNNL